MSGGEAPEDSGGSTDARSGNADVGSVDASEPPHDDGTADLDEVVGGFDPSDETVASAPALDREEAVTSTTEPLVGDYFVSPSGNNTDGRSWATAWSELDQIDWSVITPGDTVLLDGGSTGTTYRTGLDVGASGTSSSPVIIAVADDPGRDGRVTIHGGRTTPLPACGQQAYEFQEEGVRTVGVRISEVESIVIDGRRWNGISIVGHNGPGVTVAPNVSDITVRNVEVSDNGVARQGDDGSWDPDRAGVRLGGSNVTFDRVNLHDNGHDAIQGFSGDNNVADLVIRRSWLHNSRIHDNGVEAFNDCRHADGLQLYSGGRVAGITIEDSVFGPGLTNGVILGQRGDGELEGVRVDDVTLRNSVFTKSSGVSIHGYPGVKSENWIIDHVTAHCPTEVTGVCIHLEGPGHEITDSIFFGSRIILPDGVAVDVGNCRWETDGDEIGVAADPQFASVSDAPFELDDFTSPPGSPCSGSELVSVRELIES